VPFHKIFAIFDKRPIVVAIAGANGAGKSTFYHSQLNDVGLFFVNADVLAAALDIDAYRAAKLATSLRQSLVEQRESFVFETVFSDPVGDKLDFLRSVADKDYTTVLCFIGISSPAVSQERVDMRVSQGGHDVPAAKVVERFPRVLANLQRAMAELPNVLIFDNERMDPPFPLVAIFNAGKLMELNPPVPAWLQPFLPTH